ncbi:hypothetical protein DFH09DRAFT_845778, partial [Mycena vulgaris]
PPSRYPCVCPMCGRLFRATDQASFKIHTAAHCASREIWCCRGILMEESAQHGLSADIPSYSFLGRERVGGCMQVFDGRRALEEHLRMPHNTC